MQHPGFSLSGTVHPENGPLSELEKVYRWHRLRSAELCSSYKTRFSLQTEKLWPKKEQQ